MINEVIISRLDELIGDFDTPFFNYLIYSYDLSLNDCELIINDLKDDINSNKVLSDNVVSTLEDYFKIKVIELEKASKIRYLDELIRQDSEFYSKYLERYGLDDDEIELIRAKIKDKIMEDNITDFEIKRYLEYYFDNSVKQISYLRDLEWIIGRGYDTLIIKKAMEKYPILTEQDIVETVMEIRSEILDAVEFKKGIKHEFSRQCMLKSEEKKAIAFSKLDEFVEGSGDSFSQLVDFKGLSKEDGQIIVSEIREDIGRGLVQPDRLDNIFLTKRFNEYNERQ